MDLWIFAVGTGTFGLLAGGLYFTLKEFRQMKPGDSDGIRERMAARNYNR